MNLTLCDDVVEAHATATNFLWGIWAIHVAKRKLIVGRFDREGLHQLQNSVCSSIAFHYYFCLYSVSLWYPQSWLSERLLPSLATNRNWQVWRGTYLYTHTYIEWLHHTDQVQTPLSQARMTNMHADTKEQTIVRHNGHVWCLKTLKSRSLSEVCKTGGPEHTGSQTTYVKLRIVIRTY